MMTVQSNFSYCLFIFKVMINGRVTYHSHHGDTTATALRSITHGRPEIKKSKGTKHSLIKLVVAQRPSHQVLF